MTIHRYVATVLFSASFFFVPLQATAQTVSIFGSDPDALQCFDNASFAVEMENTAPEELAPCTRALVEGQLNTQDVAATHVNRGIMRATMEDYAKAMDDYDAAMALYPSYGAIYVNRGNVFFLRKSYADAIDQYTKALGANMRAYHVPHLNRGMAHEALGQLKDAEADYRQALELSPDWIQAQTKLARVLAKMN